MPDKSITTSDEEKALAILQHLRRAGSPCKQWRNTGYFDVPGVVMQTLHRKGLCERRKQSGSSPAEYRP